MDGPGNINAPPPVQRQTEHGDARMELQRREFDDDRRGKKRKSPAEFDDLQDDMFVSVQALALFLENFLKSVTEKPKKSFDAASDPAIKTEDQKAPAAPQNTAMPNARAAKAYQQTAQQSSGNLLDTADHGAETHIGETLDTEDIRLIHSILSDLKTLENQGVENLHIIRGESFLQSILSATKTALAQSAKQ